MKVLDEGHSYALAHYDAEHPTVEILNFVKRIGEGYPGNRGPFHSGTNIQEVCRVLIDRLNYVMNQARELGDEQSVRTDSRCVLLLRDVLWLLEERAARRAERPWPCVESYDPQIEHIPTCSKCGHIKCDGMCR